MQRLLSSTDPLPVQCDNLEGNSPFVLTCEHAGRAIPSMLGNLGLANSELDLHIASDLGALQLAQRLSQKLDSALFIQPYSRLVIDCNRPINAPDCIPTRSDGTLIAVNDALSSVQQKQRIDEIHQPFHSTISDFLDTRLKDQKATFLLSIHSFTAALKSDGKSRPWQIGLLYNKSPKLSRRAMSYIKRSAPNLNIAFNQPYCIEDDSDYTLPVHAEQRGIEAALVEVRNDLISTVAQQAYYAELLADAFGKAIKQEAP